MALSRSFYKAVVVAAAQYQLWPDFELAELNG